MCVLLLMFSRIIILFENFQVLKNELIECGYHFSSQTDTEAIVNLIDYHYKEIGEQQDIYKRLCDSIILATNKLCGTYGLIIMNNIYPEYVFLIKNGSPLLIAENDNGLYASSELCGFDNKVQHYMEVNNKSLVVLSCKDGIQFINGNTKTQREIDSKLLESYMTQELGIYNHYTQKKFMSKIVHY